MNKGLIKQKTFWGTVNDKGKIKKLIENNFNFHSNPQGIKANDHTDGHFKTIELKQKHGENILVLDDASSIKKYLEEYLTLTIKEPYEGAYDGSYDGVITNQGGVALTIKHADCAPVFLFSENAEIIGMLHCGWRSVHKGIINNFSRIVKNKFGLSERVYFFIGPMICGKCYEVGEDLLEQFKPLIKDNLLKQEDYFTANFKLEKGKYLFDLGKLIQSLCLKENFIEYNSSPECTKETPHWFSFRENKTFARNYSFIIKKIV